MRSSSRTPRPASHPRRAAGLHVIAKLGTLDAERLRAADELVDRIDVAS